MEVKTSAPTPLMPGEPTEPCGQCGKPIRTAGTPESTGRWCSDVCHNAWFDADPKRREGWVSLSDLTIEQQAEMFKGIGLMLTVDGKPVAERTPS